MAGIETKASLAILSQLIRSIPVGHITDARHVRENKLNSILVKKINYPGCDITDSPPPFPFPNLLLHTDLLHTSPDFSCMHQLTHTRTHKLFSQVNYSAHAGSMERA